MSHASDKVVVGKVGAPYGVKGWLRIHSFTEDPESIFTYQPWLIGESKVSVEEWRLQGKSWVAKINGVSNRDQADQLKNAEITISDTLLPVLDEDEFYWRDITAMQVVNLDGYDLGKVQEVFNTGANDVLRVKANPNDAFGQRERLLPLVWDDVVRQIDKVEKVVTVDWDPGF